MLLWTSAIIGLVGCGGGGGGSSTPATPPPVVDTDTTPPIVTLVGEQSITIDQFSTYTELGATAEDETDGNVTSSISISGSVNTEVPNVYTITYTANDGSLNQGSAERYVTVSAPVDNNKTVIDVLALYSAGADALYDGDAETLLSHIMAVSNEINNASKVGVELVLVRAQQHGISDTDPMGTVLSEAVTDTNIIQIRDNVSADEVLLYRPYVQDEWYCGLGYINTPLAPEYAISAIAIDCQTITTIHEVGHNMGNNHSHPQVATDGVGIYPYSLGHVVENDFGTVMSYASDFNAEQKLVFSNPDLECNGEPCGIEGGEVGEADASRTIRETKVTISEFR
jgi:hypothetical protein